ncbi:MAG: xanthine dehydrogenase family protein molybdopterin-binding subunit [Desulfomonilaceae bacterium]|jgi:CO/xanthine dehydrogenase Mo-binding subunit
MKNMSINIGSSLVRPDAIDKVTGQAKFATDYYGEDHIWAGVKRAGVPHAVLRHIDTSGASAMPGVIAVLTHEHINGTNRQGVVRKDQPVLVDDKIRHCGDAVALVIAETKAAVEAGIRAIRISFDQLESVTDVRRSMEPGAPLVHENHETGNILLQGQISVGAGSSGEKDCAVMVEATFETQWQEHAYLETENGWARLDDQGRIEIICSTQAPFRDRVEIAEALGMNPQDIRVIVPYIGGAFGGKDGITVQTLLALAAQHSNGRPVKMWWDREESFLAGAKRHPATMCYRLGAKQDGSLHFLEADITLDTGPYDHLGGVVLALAMEHSGGAYRIPNGLIKGRCVYTNNPIGGAFRGFGVTQATFGIERAVDMLAHKMGKDPLEIRLKNALRKRDQNFVGKTLTTSTGIVECLETLSKNRLWAERSKWIESAGRFKRRGAGISTMAHASGYGPVVPDYANAKIELTPEGKVRIYCGVVDMGQGNNTSNTQIVGTMLNQSAENIELILPDTDRTLPSCSASASRCVYTFGNALIVATDLMKERLFQKAADLIMSKDLQEFALVNGAIKHLPSNKEISLQQMARSMNTSERTFTGYFRAPVASDRVTEDPSLRLHGIPHNLFSYAVALGYVEADEITGQVKVEKYLTISDCGTVLNPLLYEQQIQGGVCQGLGLAIYEDFVVSGAKGLTGDFSKYLIPTAMDIPDIESLALGIYESSGPFGLKGIGEISINGPLPAIANAVFDATGSMVNKSPLSPENILNALKSDS